MRKTSIYLLTVLIIGIVALGNAQVNNNQTTKKRTEKMEPTFKGEEKNVFSTIEKMVAGFENKNIDAVMACYEENATVLFEPQQPVTGTELVKAAFLQAFGTVNPKYTFTDHEIYITGDIATHTTPWVLTGQLPDGTKIEQSGLSVVVLRKQPAGNWLIVQDNPHGQFLLNK